MYKILDISHWQGEVDFTKVKSDGYIGVIIKASEGKTFKDKNFKTNALNAERAGLLVGAYHYFHGDVEKESEHLIDTIHGFSFDLGVYIDIEYEPEFIGSSSAVNNEKLLAMLKAITGNVDGSVGVYCSQDFSTSHISLDWVERKYNDFTFDNGQLTPLRRWIARYSSQPPKVSYDIWQFTSKGKVDGIGGNVDVNYLSDNMLVEIATNYKKFKNEYEAKKYDGIYKDLEWWDYYFNISENTNFKGTDDLDEINVVCIMFLDMYYMYIPWDDDDDDEYLQQPITRQDLIDAIDTLRKILESRGK